MSIPVLVKKDIGVLSMLDYALPVDLLHSYKILGYAKKHRDSLFCVAYYGSTQVAGSSTPSVGKLRAMMAKF